MSDPLRIALIVGAVFTSYFVLRYIRKSRVKIEDTFFWLALSLILVILSVFPEVAFSLSNKLEFQSPINLVFLIVIFLLLAKQFFMSLQLSRLEIKIKELVQASAIDRTNDKNKKNK